MNRKVFVITGTRAEYGILVPVMKAIDSSRRLKLQVIVTGMHLMKEFGYTYDQVLADKFDIYKKIDISHKRDTGSAIAESVGKAVIYFSRIFSKGRPDIIVVLGDRGEMLAAAIAANFLNIPVAHIHGGERSGHIDGMLRHAITKLSHIHFCATEAARKRIIKLGEDPDNVFVTGAPALDRILNERLPEEAYLTKKYGLIKNEKFFIIALHPVMTQADEAVRQMRITLEAVKSSGFHSVVIYPNADAGGRKMIGVIEKYKSYPCFTSFKSIPHKDYLGLMGMASALIGNSSSGIIEAPSFKLPVINIGIRQDGRERSCNVIDVPCEKKVIIRAINKAVSDKDFKQRVSRCNNPYGSGAAGKQIAKILEGIELNKELLQKQITY